MGEIFVIPLLSEGLNGGLTVVVGRVHQIDPHN